MSPAVDIADAVFTVGLISFVELNNYWKMKYFNDLLTNLCYISVCELFYYSKSYLGGNHE